VFVEAHLQHEAQVSTALEFWFDKVAVPEADAAAAAGQQQACGTVFGA
jgi:hypothetical protein